MWYNEGVAIVAQLVEQLIRNEQVTGSIPANGSIFCELMIFCSVLRNVEGPLVMTVLW